ncbi:hypothetical protein GPJ56_008906 [Histomonas meleagridis]|uniref:uncharacterized protein n=1 Tax=Histomonas meleagridis TaxID=135588 RepID=UPI00355A3D2F|nr:hypothetical protein GPJ56_008906 [Histomonas meleagridis]KAH0797832.1 hypothetical protein GO595_009461 [Histomonas meleagridis]
MAENLRDLYIKSLAPDTSQADRDAILNIILNYYNDPQSTLTIIDLLNNEANDTLRHFAAIELGKSLKINWKKELSKSQFLEPIKSNILNLFFKETIPLIRHRLVYSCRPIFRTEAERWPQFFEMITKLISDDKQINSIEFALYSLSHIAPHLAPNTISSNLPFFVSLIMNAYTISDQNLLSTACGFCSVLLSTDGLESEGLNLLLPPFQTMLQIFSQSFLQGDERFIIQIAEKVCFAMDKSQFPIPTNAILEILYANVPLNPIYAYGPIIDLISAHGQELIPQIPQIIEQTLLIASQLFVDGSYKDNENSMYILVALEKLSTKVKSRIFLNQLLSKLSTNSPQEAIISAMALSRIISTTSESILKHISEISRFILLVFQIDHICAKEVSIDIIGELAKLLEEGQSDIGSQFIGLLINVLTIDNVDILRMALQSLKKLLMCCDIPINLIEPCISVLSRLYQVQFNLPLIFDVISYLIFSSGEDITPYIQQLLPIIFQAASIPEEQDPILKANAIEALSNIIRFSDNINEIFIPSMQLLLQSCQTNDYDIRSSVMSSLSNILTRDIPEIETFSVPIQTLITSIITEEITQDENTNNNNNEENENDDEDDEEMEMLFAGNQTKLNVTKNTGNTPES